MIHFLNGREKRKVITIEDPIEFLHKNNQCLITQRDLGDDTKSFASALIHGLRQDPDVILVGEMRDLETMATAITAAETGHLVLSTLHTIGSAATIDRIIDVFPAHQQPQIRAQLSLVLEGVLSQVLLPRADGRGRIAAFEIMLHTYAIANLIRESRVYEIPSVIETSSQQGMQTLDQALRKLVEAGLVTADEALMRAHKPQELKGKLLHPRLHAGKQIG
jgi:twitching motility protein PilT